MPWEKSFNESEVVDQVMQVFWNKGYTATSITDLTTATGIKRGSLYNAFDGKHDLFLQALLRYGDGNRTKKLKMLESIESPIESIEMLFSYWLERALRDPDKKGCMLINTAVDFTHHESDVQNAVVEGCDEVVGFCEKQITRGIELGEISNSVEARPTARSLFSALVGILVLGRGAFDATALEQIANETLKLIR
ncbi:TetR/AcrR family transcriptional regulator [Mariniblastus fucicola]|uniref:HTH-type transcriptional repressor ComR n=1 Tax=Mariniblastus fucicola TaxID=980251 RepID=A0A5B9P6P6_9BACT|nr:TetR/AcrR family transcriptional regulator [Mariniblastus fucicola]QEG20600.1 HTH-type transcriptional repressor ComR [Mariniblastus fucicola]